VSLPVGRAFVSGKRTGSALTHFNVGAMKISPFPLPPENEQAAIVEEVEHRLSIIDETAKELQRTEARAARLRQSILKRAFEGKPVPQDPTDEPAASLLKRINARIGND
jgi:type I restriction enzyme S subunit